MKKVSNIETVLSSFLHRESNMYSSSLQIDDDGCLYFSGEMIAAWQVLGFVEAKVFIDCGSNKVATKKVVNNLIDIAEKECIAYVPYNEHSLPINPEFLFVERMVSYPIWTTPNRVNPKNIFNQRKKVLDKAIEKKISYKKITELIQDTTNVATLFGFKFDVTQYNKDIQENESSKELLRLQQIEYHEKQLEQLRIK